MYKIIKIEKIDILCIINPIGFIYFILKFIYIRLHNAVLLKDKFDDFDKKLKEIELIK